MMSTFDLVVIGAGPGGYVAAIRASQLGLSVALVEERATLGGTCLNVGCVPSKALLQSSHLFHQVAHDAAGHGILVDAPRLDLPAMIARKQQVVDEVVGGLVMLMKKNGVQVFAGHGSLESAHRVRIDGAEGSERITGRYVLLATGSDAVELPFMPFDGQHVVSSTEALAFDAVPEHMVVVGAGAVGLELGSVWRRLGAEVTVIEMLPAIAPFADKMASRILQKSLKKQGLNIVLNAKVTGAEVGDAGVTLSYEDKRGRPQQVACDRVLVAVGRKPHTAGLGLEQVGIDLDDRGRIAIDDDFATNVPGVYAIGDVVRGAMLAHKAEDEAVALVERLAGQPGHIDYGTIPSVVYTEPELASVGLTEAECKEQGLEIAVGRFYFAANARAKALGMDEGLVKLIADAGTDKLLGAHMVGPQVSELIHECAVTMAMEGCAEDIALSCHAHPTLSEAVKEAALAVHKRAIHGG
jgi:dihydrolipoamide dehydrogenase